MALFGNVSRYSTEIARSHRQLVPSNSYVFFFKSSNIVESDLHAGFGAKFQLIYALVRTSNFGAEPEGSCFFFFFFFFFFFWGGGGGGI